MVGQARLSIRIIEAAKGAENFYHDPEMTCQPSDFRRNSFVRGVGTDNGYIFDVITQTRSANSKIIRKIVADKHISKWLHTRIE